MNKCTILNLIIIFVIQMVLNILAFIFWPDGFHIVQNIGIVIAQIILNIVPWVVFGASAPKNMSIEFPISNWEK